MRKTSMPNKDAARDTVDGERMLKSAWTGNRLIKMPFRAASNVTRNI